MAESLGLPDPQKQQQQQQAESREGASGASASEPGSRQSSGGSNNNFIGPVFSPAANAAATLAAASPHIGGATPGQRLALPKPRTEFKVGLNPRPCVVVAGTHGIQGLIIWLGFQVLDYVAQCLRLSGRNVTSP